MALNRYLAYACAVFVCLTQSSCFLNFVPMSQLMDQMGILHDEIADPKLREITYSSALNYGVSMIMLAGTITGVVQALVGSKYMLLMCSTLLLTGWSSIFFLNKYYAIVLGAICLGTGMQLNIAGHVGVGAFFPEMSALLLTVQGCAGDISTYVPKAMLIATRLTKGQVRPVILGYLCILFCNGIIDLIAVPRNWSKAAAALENKKAKVDSDDTEKAHLLEETHRPFDDELEKAMDQAAPKLWSAPLSHQICSVEFVTFFLYFFLSFVRNRKYFAANFRPIVSLVIPDDPSLVDEWTQLYADGNSFAFIVGLGIGVFSQFYGITRTIILHNLASTMMMGVALTSYPALQYLGFFGFTVGCYQFSMLNVFLAETFGYRCIVYLQGILLTVCGLCCLVYDYLWERVFLHVFKGSHRRVVTFWVGTNIALLVMLFYLDYRSRRANKRAREVTRTLSQEARNVLSKEIQRGSFVQGDETTAFTTERRHTMQSQRRVSLLRERT